jgi:hypothetical protein
MRSGLFGYLDAVRQEEGLEPNHRHAVVPLKSLPLTH